MQRNIMGIDNVYGIAAGKNFVIYSILGKQTYCEINELSSVFHFRASNSDKFCSLRPNIILGSTGFFLDSTLSLLVMHEHNDGDHIFVIEMVSCYIYCYSFPLDTIFCTIAVQSICTYSEYILSAYSFKWRVTGGREPGRTGGGRGTGDGRRKGGRRDLYDGGKRERNSKRQSKKRAQQRFLTSI